MTSFDERIGSSLALIDLLERHFWQPLGQGNDVVHCQYGYEGHVPETARKILIESEDPTAHFVRFAPDFLVVRGNGQAMLLEYKTTLTPRYSAHEEQRWSIGQLEADPWENYLLLSRAGFRMGIVVFCPYHPRPLVGGLINERWLIRERTAPRGSRGSGTDYVNVDLNMIPQFDEFMEMELRIPRGTTHQLLDRNFWNEALQHPELQTRHVRNPYYRAEDYPTGFNWDPDFTHGVGARRG